MDTQTAAEGMQNAFNAIQKSDWTVLLKTFAILIICVMAIRVILKFYDKTLSKKLPIDPMLLSMVRSVIRLILSFVTVTIVAGMIGIPVTSFIAIFSILGLAISLAVQGLLSNLAGGLIILAGKPFNIGDYIETEDARGKVSKISFLNTLLETDDGRLVFIPNSKLYTGKVLNYTVSGKRRIELRICTSYDDPPEKVRDAIMLAVSRTPDIIPDSTTVRLESYDDSCITYTILCWTTPAHFINSKYILNEQLYDAFRVRNVTMTYPHLNVHMLN